MFLFPLKKSPAAACRCPHCAAPLNMNPRGFACPECGKAFTRSELLAAYSETARELRQLKSNNEFSARQSDSLRKAFQEERDMRLALEDELRKARDEISRLNMDGIYHDPALLSGRVDGLESRLKRLENFCESLTEAREYA